MDWLRGSEPAGAVTNELDHRRGAEGGYGEVDTVVFVQVTRGNRRHWRSDRVAHRFADSSVAAAAQHGDVRCRLIANSEVGIAVAVEVARHDRAAAPAAGVILDLATEEAVAAAEEDAQAGVPAVRS